MKLLIIIMSKSKGKVNPVLKHLIMKVYITVKVKLNKFLTLATAEVSGQLHNPATLPPGKQLLYPFDRKMGESQSKYRQGGKKKKIPVPDRNQNSSQPPYSEFLLY
jgi:hypothetical protein